MGRSAIYLCATWLAACGGSGGVDITPDAGAVDALTYDSPIVDDAPSDASAHDAPPPAGLKIDLASTSVSGISSGGFMAVQFHVAFSSIMKGAAIFAGGPYKCSKGSVATATTSCASGSPPIDVPSLVAATTGDIDDASALAAQRVFLFGGADDTVVYPAVVDALDAYYASFMPTSSIAYMSRRALTSHTWPTLDYGTPCNVVSSPFVGKCNFDGAGAALAQIYGTLTTAATAPLGGQLTSMSQASFIANPSQHSLGDAAWVYVPASCAAGDTCKIHVAFHGCLQGADEVGDAFYAHAGLNEWADTNHIVVLYPQAKKSGTNPEGCWDFWGYDSPSFATRSAPQMAMVRAMIDALAK